MNKKLLGIAAVALLGVSAAFAATTSTVYFTASGTLTKVAESLGEETTNAGSGNNHTSDGKIGISYVYTKFSGNDTKVSSSTLDVYSRPSGKYKGEAISDDTTVKLSVKYSTNGKVANPTTSSTYSTSNPPYIYHEAYLAGLSFSNAGDYYIIPIDIYNFDSVAYTYTTVSYSVKDLSKTINSTKKTNNSNLDTLGVSYLATGAQQITLDSDANYTASYQFISNYKVVDTSSDNCSEGGNASTQAISAGGSSRFYLYIYVSSNYTGSKTAFSSVSIPLPTFTSAA